LKFTLRSNFQPELEEKLRRQEIDLVITLTDQKPPAGINSALLLKLPPILILPKESAITRAEELWARDKIEEPLICLPATEILCKHFQQGLSRLGVAWFPGVEINSTDGIEAYVAGGFGIGLSVAVPKAKLSPKVRPLELPGFAPLLLAALWRGKPSPPLRALLDEMQAAARRLQQ